MFVVFCDNIRCLNVMLLQLCTLHFLEILRSLLLSWHNVSFSNASHAGVASEKVTLVRNVT